MEDRHLCKARPLGTRKQWVTGFYAVLGEKTVIIVNEPEKFYDVDSGKNSHGNKIVEVIPNTICQCTGLKDKNGKLVWENDIVMTVYDGNEHIYQVVWDESELDFKATNGKENYESNFEYLPCCDEIEILGNCFDNLELLEV